MSDPMIDDFDQATVVQFIRDTRQQGIKPSEALKNFVGKNSQLWDSEQDPLNRTAITWQLVRLAFPEICDDVRFLIIDNCYPDNTVAMTHEAFDDLILTKLKEFHARALGVPIK